MGVKGRWTVTDACGPYNLGGSATAMDNISDKDMTSMHTTMLGDRGQGDQQGCPN